MVYFQCEVKKLIISVPFYYNSFKCIADRCKHSCCIGWEIDIDDKTLKRYKSVKGDFGKRLNNSIKSENGINSFILGKDERCPFLNKDNLCNIYIKLGESSLCQICTDHPRFRNYLSGRTEIGLGICCEEAARLILSQNEKFKLITIQDDDKAENLTEDEEYILNLRKTLIDILYDNKDDLERGINDILTEIDYIFPDKTLEQWVDFLLNLEMLDPVWEELLVDLNKHEAEIIENNFNGLSSEFINLIVYFLFRHMVDCRDWNDLCARVCFSIFGYRIIKALCINRIIKSGKCEFYDLCDYVRLFSSEIEYSQENMDAVFDELKV